MKIIKTIYQYKYSASEVIAGFKNNIITIMNEHTFSYLPVNSIDVLSNQSYYDRNRKVGASIDEMFDVLHCEFRLSTEYLARLPDEKIKELVRHRIASMIADELVKNDKIIVVEQYAYFDEVRYRCEIPFLKSKYIEELSNDSNA